MISRADPYLSTTPLPEFTHTAGAAAAVCHAALDRSKVPLSLGAKVMENRKVTFDNGIEVELDADVAANIEAARAANEDQLQRVRTAILSMPADQRRHAWDAYRLLIRATTDANNALSLADAIRAGDAELEATVKVLIHEINEARLRQDRDWKESPPSTRQH
jgi:hypothetical protein